MDCHMREFRFLPHLPLEAEGVPWQVGRDRLGLREGGGVGEQEILELISDRGVPEPVDERGAVPVAQKESPVFVFGFALEELRVIQPLVDESDRGMVVEEFAREVPVNGGHGTGREGTEGPRDLPLHFRVKPERQAIRGLSWCHD